MKWLIIFIILLLQSIVLSPNISAVPTTDSKKSQHFNSSLARYPSPTFTLRKIDGLLVPFQDGIPYPSFEPCSTRLMVNLSGTWKIYYDKRSGFNTLSPRTAKIVKELEEDIKELPPTSDWENTHVPSSNNARGSRHEAYQGVTWYYREFTVPMSLKGKFIRLVFEGVNYFVDIWLNGHYLGYHEGGFTPFIFNVTSFIEYGSKNTILVRVDNIPWNTTKAIVPYRICDWWNYGGIYREVYLEAIDPVYIARADVIPYMLKNLWAMNLTIVVHNTLPHPVGANISVEVLPVKFSNALAGPCLKSAISKQSIASANFTVSLYGNRVHAFKVSFKSLRPLEWSPESPNLYVAHVKLNSSAYHDELYTQFGFREIKVKEGRLMLNNRPIFLKGLARHEDYPVKGRALTVKDILRDLLIIKDMNANWIRTAHYPNNPMTYVLTDRIGLAVWEEIPVYWFDCEAFKIQASRGIARQMLLEMIFRDYNRPSIIIWGLANECGCYKERIDYLKSQASLARLVDPTRLLAEAIVWNPMDDTWLKAGLDLLAINAYFGVFYGKTEDLRPALDILHFMYPSVPILITEFGLWSGGNVGEQRQAEYFKATWSQIKGKKYLAGACWWTAFDYDSMIVFDTFGALSWDRSHKKMVYYEIRKAYGKSLVLTLKWQSISWLYVILIVLASLSIVVWILKRRVKKSSLLPSRTLRNFNS